MPILLGAIADDFTGATDLANTLRKEGMTTVQVIGVPDDSVAEPVAEADAVVVALKSRTAATDIAVAEALAALDWLRAHGAEQIVFKYCSTFDSTANGNIGPVADALMDALGADIAIVCPAFPENGRTIYQGHLFVGSQLLSDSPMKDHPLTPMRDANLLRLMDQQSARGVGLAPLSAVRRGDGALAEAFEANRSAGASYVVVDALEDADLRTIGAACSEHRLITGGSGIALGLPQNFRNSGRLAAAGAVAAPAVDGADVVLAGSCSEATRAQIAWAAENWPTRKLDADQIAAGSPVVEEAMSWADPYLGATPVLIYSSSDPDEVAAVQSRYGRDRAGEMIETAMGEIACRLIANGARRMIVAGGETSGAVVSALGVKALKIGPEIEPGVPWTETLSEPPIALALKSGNFGGPNFFGKALEMLR